jgi:hypothetical protein
MGHEHSDIDGDSGDSGIPDVSLWDVVPVLAVLVLLFAGLIFALLWRGL